MLEPDALLGDRYRLIRRLAVGGMGEVWEATDTVLDRTVAVKVLKEELRTSGTFLARFRAEARHAGGLGHPGIASVFDYGETPDVAFLVMELVRGRSLSQLMAEQPDLPDLAKLSILSQTAEALDAAHEDGIVHRDVKPGNLMVRPDLTVKVTDFGIARAGASASLTDTGEMIGTVAYVSPEQATGGQVTRASDIYSLGVVAYELFAGRLPFERDTPMAVALAHVNDPPDPLPGTVPSGVARLIESMLAKSPAARPQTAREVAQRLRKEMVALRTAPTRVQGAAAPARTRPWPRAARPAPAPPTPTAVAARVDPPARRRRTGSVVPVVAFVVLLAVIAVTVWAATRSDRTADPAGTSATAAATEVESTPPATTEPTTTEPQQTQPPVTDPPQTQPPVTEPAATPAPSVATTAPPPPETVAAVVTAAPAPAVAGPVTESEAVGFVTDYYQRLAAREYTSTWERLSTGFRADRNLTFERYTSYWNGTSIELDDLRFVPGPGADQGRVRFDARYTTRRGVISETDELTLQRLADGTLIITEQRQV